MALLICARTESGNIEGVKGGQEASGEQSAAHGIVKTIGAFSGLERGSRLALHFSERIDVAPPRRILGRAGDEQRRGAGEGVDDAGADRG
jgi:hypothetical protein